MTAQLYALNDGWPFGDGPLQWFCRIDLRSNEVHMVCQIDEQSIMCLAPDISAYRPGFVWNLELLKSRVADHVIRCHPDQID